MSYHILSLDGGGVRGLYTAVLLARLQTAVRETSGEDFLGTFDLLAGTSTGAILALGLARGLTPEALVAFYRDHAKEVFHTSLVREVVSIHGLLGAQYDNDKLKAVLQETLGAQTRLQDLPRRVLIPSVNLDNHGEHGRPRAWATKFFHNFPGPGTDGDQLAVDVALRSSAAPTFFPEYQGYVDGGVVANNPSMSALAQALDAGTGNQRLEDIRLLSVSAGFSPQFVPETQASLGLVHWARRLVELMIGGGMDVAHYECEHVLGPHYFRLSGLLPSDIGLADVGAMADLETTAQKADLGPVLQWVRQELLAAPSSKMALEASSDGAGLL